jgi:hypothetical protein
MFLRQARIFWLLLFQSHHVPATYNAYAWASGTTTAIRSRSLKLLPNLSAAPEPLPPLSPDLPHQPQAETNLRIASPFAARRLPRPQVAQESPGRLLPLCRRKKPQNLGLLVRQLVLERVAESPDARSRNTRKSRRHDRTAKRWRGFSSSDATSSKTGHP